MISYCFKSRKNTESKNPKILKIKIRRAMLLQKCAVYDSKKMKIIKELKNKGLLNSLTGIKVPI